MHSLYCQIISLYYRIVFDLTLVSILVVIKVVIVSALLLKFHCQISQQPYCLAFGSIIIPLHGSSGKGEFISLFHVNQGSLQFGGMGCADSTIHDIHIYNLLNENTKERFRTIIAEDDIISLIELQNTTSYPNFLELSDNGIFWTTVHFCCRFDSPCCLYYFLKKCYAQNMQQYLIFINQPTVEGLTCLHLCGIWGAMNCFILLVKFGGLNLSLKDKLERSIVNIMHDYGQEQMRQILVALQAQYSSVTVWNFEELQELTDLKIMRDPTYFEKEYKRILESIKLFQNSKGNAAFSAEEQKLREEKGRLQTQKEQIWLKISKISKEAEVKDKQVLTDAKAGMQPAAPHIATKQQQELTSQMKMKECQVQKVKDQLAYLSIRQVNTRIMEQVKRAQKHPRNIEDNIAKLNQFKTAVLKNRENRQSGENSTINYRIQSSCFSTMKSARLSKVKSSKLQKQGLTKTLASKQMANFHLFPQKIQNRYKQALKKGIFVDDQFPHSEHSLGGVEHQSKIALFLSSLVWLRPPDFLCESFKLFDGIDPDDIKQGQLGVCYCLAVISAMARNPENIKMIFQFYDLEIGFYVLRFYTNGKIYYVVLDDYFPCNSSSKQPLFSKPIGNQIWVLLIEKAWSKIVGSYFSAQLMTPDIFLQELIGCPTYGAWFKNKAQKMKDILSYSSLNTNYPIVLTTGTKKLTGIVSNHSYALLKIIQYNGSNIYKIRNPWGRFEWNGYYSSKSTLWTPELQQKCECIDPETDDGIFFLSESELLETFEYYSVGMSEIDCRVCYTEISSSPTEDLYFSFTIKKDCCFALRINQPFKRFIKDKDYKYSPVIFELGKVEGDGVRFMSEGSDKCYQGGRSVYVSSDILRKYEKGQYFVRARVQWNDYQKYNSAVLSIYCPDVVQFKRIEQKKGYQLWKKLLYSFVADKPLSQLDQNISYCMQWMKGQMICYSMMRDTAEAGSFRVKWQFNSGQLKNCAVQLGKTSESAIQYVISKDARYNIGTLDRILISKACHSGNVLIKSVKQPV